PNNQPSEMIRAAASEILPRTVKTAILRKTQEEHQATRKIPAARNGRRKGETAAMATRPAVAAGSQRRF
ncbi:MAG: hypothetical protein ACPIOQ_62220, partial [Promethearchaeia archaeon]